MFATQIMFGIKMFGTNGQLLFNSVVKFPERIVLLGLYDWLEIEI